MTKIRTRSPSHPAVDLREALDLVARLHRSDKRHEVEREVAAQNLGYSGLNGRAMSILASLSQYGLIEKVGDGRVRVSELAVKILYPTDERDKRSNLQHAALAPKLFQELHDRYGGGLPSDGNLVSVLVRDGFQESAATNVVRVLRSTFEFVRLDTEEEEAARAPSVEDGVVEVVEGNENQSHGPAPIVPESRSSTESIRPAERDVRQDVFTVEEGEVVMSWPVVLSVESCEDIEDWLNLLLRKMKRGAKR